MSNETHLLKGYESDADEIYIRHHLCMYSVNLQRKQTWQ